MGLAQDGAGACNDSTWSVDHVVELRLLEERSVAVATRLYYVTGISADVHESTSSQARVASFSDACLVRFTGHFYNFPARLAEQ